MPEIDKRFENAKANLESAKMQFAETDKQVAGQLAAELTECRRLARDHQLEAASARQEAQQHKSSVDKVVAIASGKVSAASDAHQAEKAALRGQLCEQQERTRQVQEESRRQIETERVQSEAKLKCAATIRTQTSCRTRSGSLPLTL